MPDPISSRVDDASTRLYSSDDDLTCHEEPLAPRAESSSDATSKAGTVESASSTQGESGVRGPSAEVHAEQSDLYAGAFALRGHDRSGLDIEVFSASAHAGQREFATQAGMARMGGSGGDVQLSGEVFTAQAHATYDNPDGSTGFGASAGYTVVGGEITFRRGADSLTLGASTGVTMGAAGGVRDVDQDGQPEYCGRVDFGAGSVGLCIEKRW